MRLRRAEPDDLDWLLAQERRADYALFICQWSRDRHRRNLSDPGYAYFIAVDEAAAADAEARIGFAILAGLDGAAADVELVRTAVRQAGRGHGREMLRAVLAEAFDRLGARRVWLDVYDDNPRARRTYEALGFRLDGSKPGPLRDDGRRAALLLMSLERPD